MKQTKLEQAERAIEQLPVNWTEFTVILGTTRLSKSELANFLARFKREGKIEHWIKKSNGANIGYWRKKKV